MTYEPIKPWEWPQDDLDIPAGRGDMPPLNSGNLAVSRRESFTLSGRIDIPVSTPAQSFFQTTIPTPQDGDFWCNQIYFEGQMLDSGVMVKDLPPARVHIWDMRSANPLTYPRPGVQIGFFRSGTPNEALGFNVSTVTFPAGYRSTGTLIQPFCFTRQGGVIVELTTYGATPNDESFEISLVFGGWKEYAFASR